LKIDLRLPFTADDVARLIGSKDDTRHRQIRVTRAGIAFLSDTVGSNDISGLAFRMETWIAGNGHVGRTAAANAAFVARIETVLRQNWPNPSSPYIDVF